MLFKSTLVYIFLTILSKFEPKNKNVRHITGIQKGKLCAASFYKTVYV